MILTDSRPVVEITRVAHDLIIATVQQGTHKGLETGGPLLGSAIDQGTITRAAGPGPTVERRRHSFSFNRLVDLQQLAKPGEAVLGTWHTHPASTSGLMSGADVRTSRRLRTEMDRPITAFLTVIATPNDPLRCTNARGWTDPKLTAWLVTDHQYERARLDIVDAPARPQRSSTANARTWFKATKRFTGFDDGERITVNAGEHIRGDHPLVRAYPQNFTPLPPRSATRAWKAAA